MIKRNDMTKDPAHYDYIIYYEEMTKADYKFIIDTIGELTEDNKVKCGNRYYYTSTGARKCKPLYTYKNFCCGFDIETSTINAINQITGIKDYYSAMWVCQFSIKNIGVRFRYWKDVREFWIRFPKMLHLSRSEVILVYVHNLDYETSYLKHRFNIDENTFFGKSRRKPIKYLCEEHIYLHDSYAMTNMSLEKLAESYGCKHLKTKEDIDHGVIRNCKSPISRTEERYIFNDVFILSDFAARIYEMYDFIPDTATQILAKKISKYALEMGGEFIGKRFDEWKNEGMTDYDVLKRIHGHIFGYEYSVNNLIHCVKGLVDPDMFTPFNDLGIPPAPNGIKTRGGKTIYDMYKWLYRGGIAKSNVRYTSIDDYLQHGVRARVGGMDYTSSYPFVMTAFNYPVSRFTEWTGDPDTLVFDYESPDFENDRYIFIFEFYGLRANDDYCLESVSKVRGENITEDNGRIYKADKITVCLTDCDYALYKLYYTWKEKKLLKAWKAKAGKLPDFLLYPMWESGRKKQELKHNDEMKIEYTLAKIEFNTYYGLTVKQPVYNNYYFDNKLNDNGYESTETDVQGFQGRKYTVKHHVDNDDENITAPVSEQTEKTDFMSNVRSFILSPFWGIWVCAFARFNLMKMIKRISDESPENTNDTIYCDTDSCYYLNPEKHKHLFDDWNTYARARVLSRLPAEYHNSLGTLGKFDNIAIDESHGFSDTFINFKTLGSKRYIKDYQTAKGRKISATIAGLPKGSLERFCKRTHRDIYKEFNNLFDFTVHSEDLTEQDKVKLGRKYHDEKMTFFIAGEKVTEYSSCTLYPTTFKIKMSDLYTAHIAYINNIIHGGKYSYDKYLY